MLEVKALQAVVAITKPIYPAMTWFNSSLLSYTCCMRAQDNSGIVIMAIIGF